VRSFDWNGGETGPGEASRPVELLDETLRDGLQSPSVRHPPLAEKAALLHLMNEVGIAAANIGYPGAGRRARSDATALCREIATSRLALSPKCAGRTCAEDVLPVVEVAQRAGVALEIGLFLGASPIRRYAEGWEWGRLLRMTEYWVAFACREGLRVLFVTEDTTRSRPEDLARLYQTAVQAGAQRICLADTVGCATPPGVGALVRFARASLDAAGGSHVGLDWHGHNDRGLAVANALEAARAGANRLHGTALGVGERVGNAAIEQLLLASAALGWTTPGIDRLPAYLRAVSSALNVELPERTFTAVAAGQPSRPGREAGEREAERFAAG
jgi:isopropylmalate/homocitrate/citramalate synthase